MYIGTNCRGAKRLKLIKNQNFYLGPCKNYSNRKDANKTLFLSRSLSKHQQPARPLVNFADYNGGQF